VCANRHAGARGRAYRAPHHAGIARVKPARNAARRNGAQENVVVAGFVDAEGLADISVQVYF
jgi:hypothetical protein